MLNLLQTKVKIHSDRLDVDFVVHVQDETNPAHPKCHVLTVHDIGCDRKFIFLALFMSIVKNRIALYVNYRYRI